MDNWKNEEKAELIKFWKSDIGQKYIQRMKDTKDQMLQVSMNVTNPNDAFRCTMTAAGVEVVLQDISALLATEKKEKEGKAVQ